MRYLCYIPVRQLFFMRIDGVAEVVLHVIFPIVGLLCASVGVIDE